VGQDVLVLVLVLLGRLVQDVLRVDAGRGGFAYLVQASRGERKG
jgi:hypothetical protein